MDKCVFCEGIRGRHPEIFFTDQSNLFEGMWDQYPVRPGHALLIPKRHIQHFHDLNKMELSNIATAVLHLKALILQTNLVNVYEQMERRVTNLKSIEFIVQARTLLGIMDNRPPTPSTMASMTVRLQARQSRICTGISYLGGKVTILIRVAVSVICLEG